MNENRPSLKNPDVLFLSMGGIGFSPKAPGTVASLATIPFLYLCSKFSIHPYFIMVFIVLLTLFSIWRTESLQKKLHIHDPGWIVMDEFIGMFVTWLFFPSHDFKHLLTIFVLFRIFDIVKLWPASYFDNLTHGAGTILDDVVSALFSGICYLLIKNFILVA